MIFPFKNVLGVSIIVQVFTFCWLALPFKKGTRRCGSVYLGVVVLRVCEVCYVYEGHVGSAVVL